MQILSVAYSVTCSPGLLQLIHICIVYDTVWYGTVLPLNLAVKYTAKWFLCSLQGLPKCVLVNGNYVYNCIQVKVSGGKLIYQVKAIASTGKDS